LDMLRRLFVGTDEKCIEVADHTPASEHLVSMGQGKIQKDSGQHSRVGLMADQ
jgi:hypothetical protein